MNTNKFLSVISSEAKNLILSSIAKHYGITEIEALEEVTAPDAEHLLDYLTGAERAATSVLIQKYQF